LKGFQVKSANIFNINKKKKLIILDYYSGLSGSDLILNGDVETHKILNIFLSKYTKNLIDTSRIVKFDKKPYLMKCNEIKKKITPKYIYLYKKIFKKIYSSLDSIKINFKGGCHGDLTLSNIIINKEFKKIILIDFLKTFNETPLQDICKLIQDLRLYWSSRRLHNSDLLRAKIFCDNLDPFSVIKKDLLLYKIVDLEMCMTLLRILPYVSESDFQTITWIENSFDKLNYNFYKNI
jgi:Choline/ethanolamine kinase.